MADINERLTLTDAFSASFQNFIRLGEQAIAQTATLDRNLTRAMGRSAGATIGAIRSLSDETRVTNDLLREMLSNQQELINRQQRQTTEVGRTNAAANSLLKTVRNIVVASGAIAFAKQFIALSDQQAQITARLNIMNDGLQTTDELTEMIYRSALRARAGYSETADAVAKMGMNAGSAFSSNQELIAFMELINKQFAIGGASAQGQSAAMLQLTQAMAAGALRGEELNSILDNAPGIARNIEKSMGWAEGSIKSYAEQGLVTAQVVKKAMFDMADETNAAFESMPMTFGQAMTVMKNVAQHSISDVTKSFNDFINTDEGQELLSKLIAGFSLLAETAVWALGLVGDAFLWAANNMDVVIPILAAIVTAFLLTQAAAVGAGISAAIAWITAAWPILLVAALVGVLMFALLKLGVTFSQMGAVAGRVFGMIYAFGYNQVINLWNLFASFAEFFANVFNDPVAAVANLFLSLFNFILDVVQNAAKMIDALLGSDLSGAVAGFQNKVNNWAADHIKQNQVKIDRKEQIDIGDTAAQWSATGADLGGKLDNLNFNLSDVAGSFGGDFGGLGLGTGTDDIGSVGKVGKVGKVEGDVNLSDEDVQLYRDLAEQRYMNKIELKTLAPNISVSIPEGAAKNLSAEDIANKLKTLLIEQQAAHTVTAHGV